ncbi:MAG: hypothetical protein GX684_07475 [Ruminococcaceae bacterium]|nr:hypothetical protein [Oscillospiraceae bacterium]
MIYEKVLYTHREHNKPQCEIDDRGEVPMKQHPFYYVWYALFAINSLFSLLLPIGFFVGLLKCVHAAAVSGQKEFNQYLKDNYKVIIFTIFCLLAMLSTVYVNLYTGA